MIKTLMTPTADLKIITQESGSELDYSNLNEFDIYPICKGGIHSYYRKRSNEEIIITYEQTIEINSSFERLLELLENNECVFVIDNFKIVGLVTIADLNKKAVLLHLFGLFVELETTLAEFLKKSLCDEEVVKYLENKHLNLKDKGYEPYLRYLKDIKSNVQVSIYEYLYLTNLIDLVYRNELYEKIGIDSKKSFKSYKGLIDLRNEVMHPVKSLVRNRDDVNSLLEKIKKLRKLTFSIKITT